MLAHYHTMAFIFTLMSEERTFLPNKPEGL